jgi:cephalosporin-C deacetylase-like acetyl esterase
MLRPVITSLLCAAAICLFLPASRAEPLPGTKPLTEDGNLATKMVAGIHKYLDRELEAAARNRQAFWKLDTSSPEKYAKSVEPNRERLRKYLGVVDKRLQPALEAINSPDGIARPSVTTGGVSVRRVRWQVLPGIDAEGLRLEPPQKIPMLAHVVLVPDADLPADLICGLETAWLAVALAEQGCDVLIPTLIDRQDTFSSNARLGRTTNIPHREFIHRMAFEMGRTIQGYEGQKVLAAVDWFRARDTKLPVAVAGLGEGGGIALFAAALDDRISVCLCAGDFGSRSNVWEQPLDRNVWGLLTEFGDAELGMLIAPRKLIIDNRSHARWDGPAPARPGRRGAAPGRLGPIPDKVVEQELARLKTAVGETKWQPTLLARGEGRAEAVARALGKVGLEHASPPGEGTAKPFPLDDIPGRQQRQFDQLVAYTQKLWRDSEPVRKSFWAKASSTPPEGWEKSCDWYRDYLHTQVIGKLPEPTMLPEPRTRQIYDEKTWTGHEVMLDVYPDVFACGILLLPKGLKPGEKRPVVVCQHGLEGTPRDTIDMEKRPVYNHFSRRLVELGYIVYAPQNPYYGENVFRQLQRKANPLKLSMFSFIIRQHQRTLDWLEKLPNVDPGRIAFYGLSYGGKTAMRVPALEKRYCLSICSGDFNEWIGKNVSVELDRSYVWTHEYEMCEFDLGNTFDYAEMAYLIAPRPFMVERGHDDGVGTDEMVAYEYAKVRYLYANRLKLADRTAIEFFPGGHQINARETFAFLEKHLGYPR